MVLSRIIRTAVLVALAPLASADLRTVGPAGSGAQFSEIQAAVDAALADDVILVQPGTYQRIEVAKPLRILGDGTGLVRISGPTFGARIFGIAAGEEVVLSGIEIGVTTVSSSPIVLLVDCPGTVVVHDVNVPGQGTDMTGIEVVNCARALLLDVQVVAAGYGPVRAVESEVWLANATLEGEVNFFGSAPPGLLLQSSRFHLWRSYVRGADNLAPVPKTGGPGGPGIHAVASRVDLFGGPGTEILGGTGAYDTQFGWSYAGGPGLDLRQGSDARIHAGVQVAGGLSGDGQVQTEDIRVDASSSSTADAVIFPSLECSTQQVQVGSSLAFTLNGNPGSTQVLYLSLRPDPTGTFPPRARSLAGQAPAGTAPFGLFVLDRAPLLRVGARTLPPSGMATLPFTVPNSAALIGSTVLLQALEESAAGFAISNPAMVTVTG